MPKAEQLWITCTLIQSQPFGTWQCGNWCFINFIVQSSIVVYCTVDPASILFNLREPRSNTTVNTLQEFKCHFYDGTVKYIYFLIVTIGIFIQVIDINLIIQRNFKLVVSLPGLFQLFCCHKGHSLYVYKKQHVCT